MTRLADSNWCKAAKALASYVEDMRLWEPHTPEHKTAQVHAYALAESIALADSNPSSGLGKQAGYQIGAALPEQHAAPGPEALPESHPSKRRT